MTTEQKRATFTHYEDETVPPIFFEFATKGSLSRQAHWTIGASDAVFFVRHVDTGEAHPLEDGPVVTASWYTDIDQALRFVCRCFAMIDLMLEDGQRRDGDAGGSQTPIIEFDDSVLDSAQLDHSACVLSDAILDVIADLYDRYAFLRKTFDLVIQIVLPGDALSVDLIETIRRRYKTTLSSSLRNLYHEQRKEDEDDTTRWLPAPIAVPLALSSRPERLFEPKWTRIRVTLEACARFICAVGLSPVEGATQADQLAVLEGVFDSRKPPLGKYLAAIRQRRASVRDMLPKTAELLWNSERETAHGRYLLLDGFADARNADAHGGALPEVEYVRLVEQSRPHLDALIRAIAADAVETPLVVREDLDFATAADSYDYTLSELRGASVVFPTKRIVTNKKLLRDNVYLQRPSSHFVTLHPLIICANCPRCQFQEAFFIDDVDPRSPRWLSLRGHFIPSSD